MDAILSGILTSNYPDQLKKQLIQKIAANGSQPQPEEVIRSVLHLSSNWFLNGETDLALSEGLTVYKSWARYNLSVLEAFFSREFLLKLLDLHCHNEGNIFILIHESMILLQRSSVFSRHLQVIEAKAISYVRDHPSTACLKNFAIFLEEFKQVMPKGEFSERFCVSIIQSLSLCSVPEQPKEVIEYIKDVDQICKLIHYIWNNSESDTIVLECLKAIFALISDTGDSKPSFCLGAVVQFIPSAVIDNVVKYTIKSCIDNKNMTIALQRIIDWLQWPTAKNIDQWIILFLRGLAGVKKYSILIAVTESKIDQVCEKLLFPAVREAALNVLEPMLLSFQHSPEPFHKILPMIPNICSSLQSTDSENTSQCLQRLSELLHCCMFLHAGYPDLYDPVLESIKDLPLLQVSEIKDRLSQNCWTTQNSEGIKYISKVTEKSNTGKTGLFNLGNTCYMNSILQALFMCDNFRRGIMRYCHSPQEKLMEQLQLVFAYLSHTQRPAYAPMTFSRVSRPTWFTAGHQQDCSEYLRYLLDQLHEQEKSQLQQIQEQSIEENTIVNGEESKTCSTIIQDNFGGRLATTYTCITCGKQSSRTESFTDIPLAFPEYRPVGSTIKEGGDIKADDGKSNVEKSTDTQSKPLHLNDLLQYYLKPEKLTGDNQYFCEKCDSLQDGERTLNIIEAPDYLVLTLLRFSYDVKLQSRSKIFREVKYPRTLILPVDHGAQPEKDIHNPRRSLRTVVTGQMEKFGLELNTNKGEIYSLNGVIVHSGTSSECGHYYSYARHSIFCDPDCDHVEKCQQEDEVDFLQDKWYLFNDNRVSYASYSSFSNVTQRFTKDTAYVLIYKRIDPKNAEKKEVDLNRSIHAWEVDPPLSNKLRNAVSKDNALYLQEQENSAKKKTSRKRHVSKSASWLNYQNPDDEDKGPPGSCGGSTGLDSSGPRFVF